MSEPVDSHKLRRFVAAYKLRIAEKGVALGATKETWGADNPISIDEEKKYLTEQDKFRISPFPYPGLRSFETDEGELFFGREGNVDALREILAEQRVVVVLGGSGSGKSSLVRAGLLPFLNTDQRISGRDGNWYAVEFRPRTDPLGELAAALVKQVLVPLLKLRREQLPEALGLSPDVDVEAESTIAQLQEALRKRLETANASGRQSLLGALLQFANDDLDSYDDIATRGRRIADPNLFLLVDQLEEVFRPEVAEEHRSALLDLIVDLHAYMRDKSAQGGLFLAATIRSEEVHRCAEHRGLSEVVIGSGYQIELLDPRNPEDAEALKRSIIKPARNVLEDWGFADQLDHPDAPFADGMPNALLAGAERLAQELDHRPDQLPLLQHALQASWHAAMRRWSREGSPPQKLEITRVDLPGQSADWEVPDLSAALRERADKAGGRAADRFKAAAGIQESVGLDALKAAFRALARRDDRGNWARRFAGRAEITAFLEADVSSKIAHLPDDIRWKALQQALRVFQLRGYMNLGVEQKYDISHEALIRNWPQFQEWLRAPEEVAYALGRVLIEVDPAKFEAAPPDEQDRLIPADLAQRVESVAAGGKLPPTWGEDQIAPYLLRPAVRKLWGGNKTDALRSMTRLVSRAQAQRKKAHDAELAADRKRFFKQGVTISAIVLAFLSFIAFITIQKVDLVAKDVALLAKDNALIAKEKMAKQAAANGLTGLMRGDISWPEGLRERVAIHVLGMLGDGGRKPDEEFIRQRAWTNWDAAIRTILGDELRVVRLHQRPHGENLDTCITLSDDAKAPSVESKPIVLPGSNGVELRLLSAIDQNAPGLRFRTKKSYLDLWSAGDVINIPVSNGARVCLTRDGSALTASYPGAGLPYLADLVWVPCDDKACKAGDWRVTSRPLKTVGVPQLEGTTTINCVRAIRTVPVRDGGSATARLEVDFDAEACDSDSTGAKATPAYFRASYIPGVASAKPTTPGDLKPEAFTACRETKPDELECPLETPYAQRPKLNLFRNAEDIWSASITPFTPEYPLQNVLVIGPKVEKAAVDKNNNIVLVDKTGSYRTIINDREALKAELWARTERLLNDPEWHMRAPIDVSNSMEETERNQKPPTR